MIKIPNFFKFLVIFHVFLTSYANSLYVNQATKIDFLKKNNCLSPLAVTTWNPETNLTEYPQDKCEEQHSQIANLLINCHPSNNKKDQTSRWLIFDYWWAISDAVRSYFESFSINAYNINPQLINQKLLPNFKNELLKVMQQTNADIGSALTPNKIDEINNCNGTYRIDEDRNKIKKNAGEYLAGIEKIIKQFNIEFIEKNLSNNFSKIQERNDKINSYKDNVLDYTLNFFSLLENIYTNFVNAILNQDRITTTNTVLTSTEAPTTTTTVPTTIKAPTTTATTEAPTNLKIYNALNITPNYNPKRNEKVDDQKTNMQVWPIVGFIFAVLSVIVAFVIGVWQCCFKNKAASYDLENPNKNPSKEPLLLDRVNDLDTAVNNANSILKI